MPGHPPRPPKCPTSPTRARRPILVEAVRQVGAWIGETEPGTETSETSASPPESPSDPIEALRFHMDRLGLGQADLIPYMGAGSRVSEVLSGRRGFTLETVRNLSSGLGIPAESLIGAPQKDKRSAA